jgi:tetratricopeptide (TPR) repeat protein
MASKKEVPSRSSKTSAAPAANVQMETFNKAMALFHGREFRKAMELFEKAQHGTSREVSHTAKLHLRMCEQRLQGSGPQPKTAEEMYTVGIAMLNARNLDAAVANMEKALQQTEADHYHYALALAYGLKGSLEKSAEHLRRAIELRPSNKIAAANDPDFAELLREPQLREVIHQAA